MKRRRAFLAGILVCCCFLTNGMAARQVGPKTGDTCNDARGLLQKRLRQLGIPHDWQPWWNKISDGSRLEAITQMDSPEKDSLTALLISCLVNETNVRAEGNRQWLMVVRQAPDTLLVLETMAVGSFYCCGGQWMHEPSLAFTDLNRDGRPEVLLRGRYEHGSDSHQLEGEAEFIFFLGADSTATSRPGCIYPPPGFSIKANLLPVIKHGVYKYFGPPRLDLAPVNRVQGNLRIEKTAGSGRPATLILRHIWLMPEDEQEIQRWYESGDFSEFTQFHKQTRTEVLAWDSEKRGLEVLCPSQDSLFHLSGPSAQELVVEQNGTPIWSLYFDEPVLEIRRHPVLPLAAIFTSLDTTAAASPIPTAVHALYLVNLWSGEQQWIELQNVPPERWFFQIWSPRGTYMILPDGFSSDLLLFKTEHILDERDFIRYEWFANPDGRLSLEDIPGAASEAMLTVRAWHSDTAADVVMKTKSGERWFRYEIIGERWDILPTIEKK